MLQCDVIDRALQRHAIQRLGPQGRKGAQPVAQQPVGLLKGQFALGFGAFTGDVDGDGSDGQSSGPSNNSPSSSQGQHPANQGASTSSSTAS